MLSFLWISIRSFEKDKISYVFDYIMNTNQAKIEHFEATIKDLKASLTLYIHNNRNTEISDKIKFLLVLGEKKEQILRGDPSRSKELPASILKMMSALPALGNKSKIFTNEKFPDEYFLAFKSQLNNSVILTSFDKSLIDSLFDHSESHLSFAHENGHLLTSLPLGDSEIIHLLQLDKGKVIKVKIDQDYYYAVANDSQSTPQTFVTALREVDLFQFTKSIRNQNFALALLIISISSILGILFAKRLTNSINLMTEAATEVSKGNYEITFDKIEKDEIGILQSTFTTMARAVKQSVLRERDLLRMENDLKIARLVQETFFPEYTSRNQFVDVACFYGPANECSGDWWGFFTIDHFQYYFMGDATGHGVSSALITAKAYSIIYGMKNQMLEKEIDYLEPSRMMENLNNVLCSSKQVLMMTFFIMRLDTRTNEVLYSNASHEIPIIISQSGEASEMFEPRMPPESRLGEESGVIYKNYRWKLNRDDILLLYTDGLTECATPDRRYFGVKRVILALKKLRHLPPSEIVEGLVKEIGQFSKTSSFEDDVGLMVIKILT